MSNITEKWDHKPNRRHVINFEKNGQWGLLENHPNLSGRLEVSVPTIPSVVNPTALRVH